MNCIIHEETDGVIRPAIETDKEFGPLCQECSDEINKARGQERYNSMLYAYACGYVD